MSFVDCLARGRLSGLYWLGVVVFRPHSKPVFVCVGRTLVTGDGSVSFSVSEQTMNAGCRSLLGGAPQVAGEACGVLSAALTDPFPEAKRECCSLLLRLAVVCPGGLRSRLGKVGMCGCCLALLCPRSGFGCFFKDTWFIRFWFVTNICMYGAAI